MSIDHPPERKKKLQRRECFPTTIYPKDHRRAEKKHLEKGMKKFLTPSLEKKRKTNKH